MNMRFSLTPEIKVKDKLEELWESNAALSHKAKFFLETFVF